MVALLLDSDPLVKTVIIAAVVLAVVAFLYGVLRKFSRMSWLGWQTAVLFALSMLIGMLPAQSNGYLSFGLAAGFLLAAAVLVFVLGCFLRTYFLALEVGGTGGKVFNRLLGGVTAIFNIVVFAAIFGGWVLALLQNTGLEFLNVVYTNPFWTGFFGARALDLVLVYFFALMLRWGYRLGFLRVIITIIAIALAFAAAFAAMYCTLQVPFIRGIAVSMAGTMKMNSIAAGWVSFAIVSFLTGLVFMAVVGLIVFLMNLLLKLVAKSRVLNACNGALFALIAVAIFFAFVLGGNFAVSYLIGAAESGQLESLVSGLGAVGESMAGFVEQIAVFLRSYEQILMSNPLTNIFYTYNPLRLLIS